MMTKNVLMRYATPHSIIAARDFFRENPNGEIYTGFPTGYYNKEDFYRWFNSCLNIKCGGMELTEKNRDMQHDQRIVSEYKNGRRSTGCRNILHTKLFKTLYPHIDNQIMED